VAAFAAIVLGVWLAFALQAVVIGLSYESQQYGWQEIYAMAKESASPQTVQSGDLVVDIGADIMKWGPLGCFFAGPIIFFAYCSYGTGNSKEVFVRLRAVFLLFVIVYIALVLLGQNGYVAQFGFPIDLSTDGRWKYFWMFVILFGATFWSKYGRSMFGLLGPPAHLSGEAPTAVLRSTALTVDSAASPVDLVIPVATSHGEAQVQRNDADIGSAVLSYITFVPALIMLTSERSRRSPFIRFHAIQSVLLSACWIGVWALCAIVGTSILDEQTLETLYTVARLCLFVAWLFAIIGAGQGKRLRLPVIGSFALRQSPQP
jgi:uncharacterized membrane protein